MRMTTDEFDEAVELLQQTANPHQWTGTDAEQDRLARVIAAAGCVLKHRRGIPDDAEWTMPAGALEEFLASLTPTQRRKLRRIAESLQAAEHMAIH
jgi:hypothetical protein